MQHTGPVVDKLDAESNSRLIRRLIHMLSSASKEPISGNIDHIFAWLWNAVQCGIHFTASQVEDLATALQRVAAPVSASSVSAPARAEAARLLIEIKNIKNRQRGC